MTAQLPCPLEQNEGGTVVIICMYEWWVGRNKMGDSESKLSTLSLIVTICMII